ncbi:C2H2 finger domain-containing protein [Rutstroemia sp. NJR-2017a BBW]|nr:C2H2 finger domain-containing protein [Rutstroemia sp. NJR-2017a BBW]
MPQDEPCKFCGKAFTSWKKLTVHLAKHMEHISLPVLLLVEQKDVDADTIISPVEQNMTPFTPIGRTKLEDSSPYSMMDTVSPNISMTPQFTAGFHPPTGYPTSGSSPTYVFPSTFNVQPMNQPRQFNPMNAMDVTGLGNMQSTRAFGLDTAFTSNPVDQSRAYGSMDSAFSMHPTPTFNQPTDFSISQPFVTTSPAVTTYQTPNLLGINDSTNLSFDTLSVAPMQNFQQVPMRRAQGSSSSYGQGEDEGQRLNLLHLNSITEFLMKGEPFERFKKHLRWFIHPPKTLSEAVECAEAGLISKLVTETFDSVAREEYFWLHELLEIGYTKEEIAELLIEKAQDAPWICYDENKAIPNNVFQVFHAPLCVHREFTSDRAPSLDGASASVHLPGDWDNTPTKMDSLSGGENLIESSVDQGSVNSPSKTEPLTANVKQTIQQLCGLGGVCPTRQKRHEWNGQWIGTF